MPIAPADAERVVEQLLDLLDVALQRLRIVFDVERLHVVVGRQRADADLVGRHMVDRADHLGRPFQVLDHLAFDVGHGHFFVFRAAGHDRDAAEIAAREPLLPLLLEPLLLLLG